MAISPRQYWWFLSIGLTAASVAAVLYYRLTAGPGYPLDDSWIHLTFARNLASGDGFGANPSEPTPGATSPLWVVLVAAGYLAGAGHEVWPWLLGAFSLAAAALLAATLVQTMGFERSGRGKREFQFAGATCGLAVAWLAPLVWSAAGAMEVPLFSACVCGALVVFVRSQSSPLRSGLLWGTLAGLAALARPEGLLLCTVLVALSLVRSRRMAPLEALGGLVASAIVNAPSVAFCLSTSGRVFPNTFYAKTTSLVAGAPDVGFLFGATRFFFRASPAAPIALLAGLAAVVVLWRRRQPALGIVAVPLFAVGLPVAYAAMGRTFLFAELAGNFDRYLYPSIPLMLVFGFWGIAFLVSTLQRPWLGQLGAAVAVVVAMLSILGVIRRADLYRHNVSDVNTMQVSMARRLAQDFRAGDLVAANDVGALAYFTDLRVLDLIGIISTSTLEALEQADQSVAGRQRAIFRVLARERPVGLVVFPDWYQGTLQSLGEAAEPIESIEHRANITSGGYRLVAYRIDWDRL